jgi:integrase
LLLCYGLFYISNMKRRTHTKAAQKVGLTGITHNRTGEFTAVRDSGNRKVRGLWRRNSRYYAQIRVPGERSARKVPLVVEGRPAANLTEAREALTALKADKPNWATSNPRGRKPTLSAAIAQYLEHFEALATNAQNATGQPDDAPKRTSTVNKERSILRLWQEFLGDAVIDRITDAQVNSYADALLKSKRKRRTANIHVSILRNLLSHFADRGVIAKDNAARRFRTLRHTTPKREFLTPAQLSALLAAADDTSMANAESRAISGCHSGPIGDLIRLLAYSGAREMEALRLRWEDVDFENGVLHIGRDGNAKNREARTVDLNPELAAHLRDMQARRAPDSPWLFPSPRRGDAETHSHWVNPHRVWYAARKSAGLPKTHLHDLRHFFASKCIMAGIDFMTVASWLGHKDGGILVGKVYGHLADTHKADMAARLVFTTPRVLDAPKASVRA